MQKGHAADLPNVLLFYHQELIHETMYLVMMINTLAMCLIYFVVHSHVDFVWANIYDGGWCLDAVVSDELCWLFVANIDIFGQPLLDHLSQIIWRSASLMMTYLRLWDTPLVLGRFSCLEHYYPPITIKY